MVDVAIVGAGPYGLSLAAHLKARRLEFRIFGRPMETWLNHMPQGMRLKSEGFASTLYDPDSLLPLSRYCEEQGLAYADIGLPIPLETFTGYGLEFQKRLVPELEERLVQSVSRSASGFHIVLSNGETASARKVVVAVGLSYFQYVPPMLANLPEDRATHSSGHQTFDQFRDQDVVVLGAGASAADVSAALLDAGARVQIVARDSVFRFHDPPGKIPRPLMDRMRAPMTGLGPGWRSWMCVNGPLLFRQMPEAFRLKVVRKHLGPAGGYVVKDRVVGRAPFHLGFQVTQAEVQGGKVRLQLAGLDGSRKEVAADHVIAATGYRTDLSKVSFFRSDTLSQIRSVHNTPMLSSHFESSVPGLYFVGAASANTFGPLARFAYGAGFTCRRLSRHLAGLAEPGVPRTEKRSQVA
ncbi:MAG TPA: NAD(P)-binding domain-containing protein [Bryobacteraceae bacterium]|nr:NAD(P)-binding domain-containing protein [Bryobacteraceae bacterium]